MAVRIGISGRIDAGWRGLFYQPGLKAAEMLPHAARHFDTIEINATAYRLQRPEHFTQWRARLR